MTVYRFLPEARDDLARAVVYYDSEFPDLGQDLAREAQRLCRLIAESPLAGQEVRLGIRRRLLRRFPYAILYSRDSSGILVVAVMHQRRRPDYWRSRI
jgi:plasmid stabilization system protein ParE